MNKDFRLRKMGVPELPDVVSRRALIERMRSSHCHVLWVGGPGGAGKTTLVADFVRQSGMPCLWYELDASDGDPANFFFGLGQATQQVAGAKAADPPAFMHEQLLAPARYARLFFTNLFSHWDQAPLLVLDNLQELGPRSVVFDLLATGLAYLPIQTRVVLISREGVPPKLQRLRANQELLELGWEDLRLSEADCAAIIRQHGHGGRAPEIARSLYQIVDGWAAGLILMLQEPSLGSQSPDRVVLESQAALFSYIASEVYDRLPSDYRRILRQTALLGWFSPERGEQLVNGPVAEALDSCCRMNTLIRRVKAADSSGVGETGPRVAYHYHPIFRDFLLERLRLDEKPEVLAALMRQAAAILEAEGRLDEAAHLMAEAADWDGLARLCMEQAPAMMRTAQNVTLAKWIHLVPAATRDGHPWLNYFLAQTLSGVDPAAAHALFERTHDMFWSSGDLAGEALSWAGVANMMVQSWGKFANGKPWLARARKYDVIDADFPDPLVAAEVCRARLDLLTWSDLGSPVADRMAENCLRLTSRVTDPFGKAALAGSVVMFQVGRGNIHAARLALDIMEQAGRSENDNPVILTFINVVGVYCAWNAGETALALRLARDCLKASAEMEIKVWDMGLHVGICVAGLLADDLSVMEQALEALKDIADPARDMLYAQYLAISGMYWLRMGDRAVAREMSEEALLRIRRIKVKFPEGWVKAVLALLELGEGNLAAAERHLADLRQGARDTQSQALHLFADLIGVELAERSGDRDAALTLVREGLARARTNGLRGGPPILAAAASQICALALAHDIECEQARAMIQIRALAPPDPLDVPENWPWPIRIETFGAFRLMVNDEPVAFSRKAQRKPLDMLKFLCIAGGTATAASISDSLWPDSDGDSAHSAFATTLSRLRKLLERDRALILRDGRLSLNPDLCGLDLWRLEGALSRPCPEGNHLRVLREISRKVFLPGDEALPGVEAVRHRLAARIEQAIIRAETGPVDANWRGRKRGN